ncbi:hypothetical protein PtA15_8A756 [Puccinia triticina]|uniref:Uncharacterized protein n=1 Tax=Puccinia triticina TaxID=208348 RepID=A0ABY7CT73_9BASI|nr:uncharacterized protein PtA15_8A756 [Puccinia triticina]WAQ87849.1 hypothetical protein PtA15_8A756 [Puccinia triticina]
MANKLVEEIAQAVVPMAYAAVMPSVGTAHPFAGENMTFIPKRYFLFLFHSFMMNNQAIIDAMPQLPPALAIALLPSTLRVPSPPRKTS